MPRRSDTRWQPILTHSRAYCLLRSSALFWRDRTSVPVSVVWIDGDLGCTSEARSLITQLASRSDCERLSAALDSGDSPLRRRALSAVHDRIALQVAIAGSPAGRRCYGLAHTSLGQPIVCDPDGCQVSDHHVSFSHDGSAHICLLAQSPDLCGVGIDVVHLPRLRGRSDEYLLRFAGKFMSDEELDLFVRAAEGETGEALLRRVSAHFSLMESASKALGTGLKIGAGMGKPESLPKQALGVSSLEPEVKWLLGPEAESRCRELNAVRMEGHWATDEEYGVSAVLLFR